MSDQLIKRVAAICDEVAERLRDGRVREQVLAVRRRLSEPLRVALAGSVNAGKSTILNALLQERIAPTEQGECTQVVTWFWHRFAEGGQQGARIDMLDSAQPARPLALLPDGRIPVTLGVDPELVESVSVWRANDLLEHLTLIDTPGLGSANAHISDRTRRMLSERSHDAERRADALVYVMTNVARASDEAAITAFRRQFPDHAASAANTVAVLNKADKGSGPLEDRLAATADRAAQAAHDLGGLVTDVIPMVGLLAESAIRIDEEDAAALRALAELGPDERDRMLEDFDEFLAVPCPSVGEARRRRLWELLDTFGLHEGLRLAAEHAAAGRTLGAGVLREHMMRVSGIEDLRRLVATMFGARSNSLRAEAATRQLQSIAYGDFDGPDAAALTWLRGTLDDLRLEPEWHQLAELRAMHRAAAEHDAFPPDLLADLTRLVTGSGPDAKLGIRQRSSHAERAEAAAAGVQRWREAHAEYRTEPAVASVSRVAQRSYELLHQQHRHRASR